MDCVSIELRHLIRSSESLWLVTLGVCRHLDGVEASCIGDLLKEACEKARRLWVVWCSPSPEWRKSNPSGSMCWFGLEPVQVVRLTSEVLAQLWSRSNLVGLTSTWIRGDRQVFEHHGKTSFCHCGLLSYALHCAIYIHCIIAYSYVWLLTCLCLIDHIFSQLLTSFVWMLHIYILIDC